MPAPVTTASVWKALSQNSFAVLSWVTPGGEPRSAGIVYVVRDRKLCVGTGESTWKARHIRANPNVSVTATLSRKLPLLPFIPIPDATITFRGKARVLGREEVDPEMGRQLTQGMTNPELLLADLCVVEITPRGEFVTYGIDVSKMEMRDAVKAQGRAPVA